MSNEVFGAGNSREHLASPEAGQVRDRRNRTYKAGIASYQNHTLIASCIIRDLTPRGAKLKFEKGALVPERFLLTIPADGTKVDCEVKWRGGLELGVSFVSDVQPDTRNVRRQSVDVEYLVPRKPTLRKASM